MKNLIISDIKCQFLFVNFCFYHSRRFSLECSRVSEICFLIITVLTCYIADKNNLEQILFNLTAWLNGMPFLLWQGQQRVGSKNSSVSLDSTNKSVDKTLFWSVTSTSIKFIFCFDQSAVNFTIRWNELISLIVFLRFFTMLPNKNIFFKYILPPNTQIFFSVFKF